MSSASLAKLSVAVATVAWMALPGGLVHTQDIQQGVQPVNSGESANPYRTIRNWGTEPPGRPWGAANGIGIDRDGKSVWVADRCGTAVGCVGSNVDPIQK